MGSARTGLEGRVLLVEDHRQIAELVCSYLDQHGFVVDYAPDGLTGLHLAVTNEYEAIVLDLMLPAIDGLEVCRRLRQDARRSTPVLMLTARDTLDDRITGLDTGADDYLVKPFDIRELHARLRSLIRRHRGVVAAEVLQVADLTLDTATHVVRRANHVIPLSPTATRLLALLMRSAPRLVTRGDMERELWGDDTPDSDALRSHLYNLRKMIDRPFGRALLKTVPGLGVRLDNGPDPAS